MTGPYFIDNRNGDTFAKSIRAHLKTLRKAGDSPDELCIATGYFNAAGWLQVAEEAERLGKVRLLIGAEPTPSAEMILRQPGDHGPGEQLGHRPRRPADRRAGDVSVHRHVADDARPLRVGAAVGRGRRRLPHRPERNVKGRADGTSWAPSPGPPADRRPA